MALTIREQITSEVQKGAGLQSVVARYAAQGFTEEDLDYELDYARKNVEKRKREKAEAPVGLPEAVGETTTTEGIPQAQTAWSPIQVGAKIGGVIEGAVEGVKNLTTTPEFLVPALAKTLGVKGWKGKSNIQQAAQEEVARKEKLIAEKPFIERLGQDVGNVVSAIPHAVHATLGPDVVPEGETPAQAGRRTGKSFGEVLPKGVAGGLAAAYDPTEFVTNVSAEPLTALMDYVPILGAAGKLAKAGALATKVPAIVRGVETAERLAGGAKALPGKALTKAAEPMQDLAAAAAERIGLDKTGGWLKAGNLVTRAERFLIDPAAHPDKRVQTFTQELGAEPRRVEGSISKRGESVTSSRPGSQGIEDFAPPLPPERTLGVQRERLGTESLVEQQTDLTTNIAENEGKLSQLRKQEALESQLRSNESVRKRQAATQARIARTEAALAQQKASLSQVEERIAVAPVTESVGLSPVRKPVDPRIIEDLEADLFAAKTRKIQNMDSSADGDILRIQAKLDEARAQGGKVVASGLQSAERRGAAGSDPRMWDMADEASRALEGRGKDFTDVRGSVLEEMQRVLHSPMTIRELIRDPKFRKEFQRESGLSDAQIKTLQTGILDPTSLGLDPQYAEAFNRAVKKVPLDAATRKRVVAQTVSTLADDAAKATKKKMLDSEATRLPETVYRTSHEGVLSPDLDSTTAAAKYADMLLDKGQMPVQALKHGQNPSALAAKLEGYVDGLPKDKARVLKAEIRRLKTFKQLDKDLIGSDHWVDPLLHTALTSEAQAQAMMRGTSKWAWITAQMKANLTARNLKSAMNNLISNSSMQALRRGDPLGGVGEMLVAWRKEAGGKKALRGTPEWETSKAAKWAALERTGLFDSNILKQELKMNPSNPWNNMLEKFYTAGDTWFKRGEAHRAYDELEVALKDLNVGETVTFDVGRGHKVTLKRRPPSALNDEKWQLVDPTAQSKRSSDFQPGTPMRDIIAGVEKLMGDDELADVIAKAAAHRANAMFFDYGDVPGLGRFLRSQPALGILSPFFTYVSKALDLPGKGGLGTQVVKGSQGWINSNSPKVLAKQASWQAAEAVRRSVMLHAAKQELLDGHNEDLTRAVQYMPRDLKPTFIAGLSSPTHMAVAGMGNWNVFDPTLTAARLGFKYLAADRKYLDPTWAKEDPKAARLMYLAETGQLGGAADALSLIGMGGSAITDLLAKVDESERTGKNIDMGSLVQSFGPAMLGGTTDMLRDLATGAVDENSPYTSRYSGVSSKDPQAVEDFTRWAIRKATGMGWKALKMTDERSFKALGKKWHESLGLPGRKIKAEKRMNEARVNGDVEAFKAAQEELVRVKRLGDIVDDEMDKHYREWLTVARKVYEPRSTELQNKAKVSP